jgi:hypothetical protein
MPKHKRLIPHRAQFSWWMLGLIILSLVLSGLYLIHRSEAYSADINGDGKIDIADLSILAANYGQTGRSLTQGDINGDGSTNILDLSILAAQFGTTVMTGPTYYLATNGSDSNPGTLSSPWKSFNTALPKLRPGDTLMVRGGTYSEHVNLADLPDGTSSKRINLRNYQTERPIIENQFQIGTPSFWTISGINFHWTTTSALPGGLLVRIYGGTGWIFENGEIWGARGTAGIHIDDGPANSIGNWTLRDNCIHDTIPTDGTNQDHLVYVNTTTGGTGLIERNILFNSPNGRGIKFGPGGDTGGPNHVTARYNTFYNNLGPSNIQVSKDTSNITIYRNIMDKSSAQNITAFSLTGTGNLAHDNAGWDSTGVVGTAPGLSDGGGNVKIDPQFDSTSSCNSFHPQNNSAKAYGKFSP